MSGKKIYFADKPINQIVAEIRALKGTEITQLDLSMNAFHKRSVDELTAVLGALIETGIISLDLSLNEFYQRSVDELTAVLDTLKKTRINSLDLSLNDLYKLDVGQTSPLSALKETGITHLNLSRNILGFSSNRILASLFGSLKGTSVTHLDLCMNNLGQKSAAQLATLFSSLKETEVTHLDLGRNNLGDKSAKELKIIFDAIPVNIVSVGLYYSELKTMGQSQRQAIQNRFDHADNIILYDEKHINLEPSLRRNDARAYRTFGFKISAPSLLNRCAFFIAQKRIFPRETCQAKLPSELNHYINSFRSTLA